MNGWDSDALIYSLSQFSNYPLFASDSALARANERAYTLTRRLLIREGCLEEETYSKFNGNHLLLSAISIGLPKRKSGPGDGAIMSVI